MLHDAPKRRSNEPATTISGSFRKHLLDIRKAAERFRLSGVQVLAPAVSEAVVPGVPFVILTSDDPMTPPHTLEANFMRQLRDADFQYVADIAGYVGLSAASEMAYARLKRVPIIIAEPIRAMSDDIPHDVQALLRELPAATLPIQEITSESIAQLRESLARLSSPQLTDRDARLLFSLVTGLLRQLRTLAV